VASAFFRLPSHFFFNTATFSVRDQGLRVLLGLQPRGLARLYAFDLFFDGAESHLGATSQLIFLRATAGLFLQIVPLFLGAASRL